MRELLASEIEEINGSGITWEMAKGGIEAILGAASVTVGGATIIAASTPIAILGGSLMVAGGIYSVINGNISIYQEYQSQLLGILGC